MVKIDLPYLKVYRVRGKVFAYYRRGGASVRLRGEVGTQPWRLEYEQAHADFEAVIRGAPPAKPAAHTLAALWSAYVASGDFIRLAPGSKSAYRHAIEPLLPAWGHNRVAGLQTRWVQERVDEIGAKTPRSANIFLTVMRVLLNWGIAREWLATNPAKLAKPVRYRKSPHRAWTDAEINAMTEAGLPVRLGVLLGLFTAQRLGDVLAMPWASLSDGSIDLVQSKTGAVLSIPVHPTLAAALADAPRSDDTICARPDGARWKVDHFKHVFAATRSKLGLPSSLHFHGLRHSAASRLAEAGCSHAEIAAITGHKSIAMVSHYAAGARQKSLARTAMGRLPKGDVE